MKFLKAFLIVVLTVFTFGSAIAQDSHNQRDDQSRQHHYRRHHKRHHRMSDQRTQDQRTQDQH